MSATSSWIGDVLTRFDISYNIPDEIMIDHYLLMVNRSDLIERVYGTCRVINAHVRGGLIYGQLYAQPHAPTFRIGFVRGDIEFRMSLAILDEGPTLIFSSCKEHQWVESVLHHFGHRNMKERENVISKLVINPATVSDADLEQWFTYLLSGLRRPFKPARKIPHPKEFVDLRRTFSSEESI
jgi:hypothetical protein